MLLGAPALGLFVFISPEVGLTVVCLDMDNDDEDVGAVTESCFLSFIAADNDEDVRTFDAPTTDVVTGSPTFRAGVACVQLRL